MRKLLVLIALLVPCPCGWCLAPPSRVPHKPGLLAATPPWQQAGSPVSFKKLTSAKGNFSILIPGTPKRSTQTVKGLEVTVYTVEVKDGAFAVSYTDVPAGTRTSLAGAVRGMANSHGKGKILALRNFTLAGTKGREFEVQISNPAGYIAGRVILVNDRLYQVMAVGTQARLSSPTVRKFLDSLTITR